MHEDLWRKIVIVHNENKSLFIWCEENCTGLKSFLQPNNELKNAWEHVVRAKANELGIVGGEPNEQYARANLDKVLGHEYRAFFDICDWLSIHLRDRISKTLISYDNETINAVIPNYYTDIRPKAERICTEIANLRSTKDIALSDDVLKHVKEYKAVIAELIKNIDDINFHVPALEEYKKKHRKAEFKVGLKELLFVIIGAGLFALGEWLVEKSSGK